MALNTQMVRQDLLCRTQGRFRNGEKSTPYGDMFARFQAWTPPRPGATALSYEDVRVVGVYDVQANCSAKKQCKKLQINDSSTSTGLVLCSMQYTT